MKLLFECKKCGAKWTEDDGWLDPNELADDPSDPPVTTEHVKTIADMTVALTREKLARCEHLAIENFAPALFGELLAAYDKARRVEVDGEGLSVQNVDLFRPPDAPPSGDVMD